MTYERAPLYALARARDDISRISICVFSMRYLCRFINVTYTEPVIGIFLALAKLLCKYMTACTYADDAFDCLPPHFLAGDSSRF